MTHSLWRRHPTVRTGPRLSLGERAADRVRNAMGSWLFIAAQTVICTAWVALNLVAWSLRWDPYPFILLNLAFSVQAAYASPIILLSQKRGDATAAEVALNDLRVDERTERMQRQILSLQRQTLTLQRRILATHTQLTAATEDDAQSDRSE